MPKCQASNVPIQCLIQGHLQVQVEIIQTPNSHLVIPNANFLKDFFLISSISSPNLRETQMRLSSPFEDRNPEHEPSLGPLFCFAQSALQTGRHFPLLGRTCGSPGTLLPRVEGLFCPFIPWFVPSENQVRKIAIFFQFMPSPRSSFISALPTESFPDPTEGWIPCFPRLPRAECGPAPHSLHSRESPNQERRQPAR